jgi:hypothetical protein
MKTVGGRVVPVQQGFGRSAPIVRKLLIVLPYYEGDKQDAEDLATLICELERLKVKNADIMLFRRHDATEFSKATVQRLSEKFDKVHFHVCRRRDGVGHPFAPSQMWYDIVTLLGQVPTWAQNYYAFLWLEPDTVPTRPGWIDELITAYNSAQSARNKFAIGFIHQTPVLHMNGVAVYAIDIWRQVPGDKLGGGNPQAAFDIDKAMYLLPMSEDTPLIYFEYKRPTITSQDLFSPRRFGIVPCLWHGIKDSSARDAVRARHVTFNEKPITARPTVFTFFQSLTANVTSEDQSILSLWQEGWKSRGFNPVIMRGVDAAKHEHYTAFMEAIQKLPSVIEKQIQINRFLRWLALDALGGGMMVEYDILPARLTPQIIGELSGFHLARPGLESSISMAYADRPALKVWLDRIQNYDPQPDDLLDGRKNVTDLNVMATCAREDGVIPEDWVKQYGAPQWSEAAAVHFSGKAIQDSSSRGKRKSELMEAFLRGA